MFLKKGVLVDLGFDRKYLLSLYELFNLQVTSETANPN